MKFYRCNHCGNIIAYVEDKGVPVKCCGETMKELVANTVDASVEKHTPVVTVNGNKIDVVVGSVEHPMGADHYIAWVAIQTKEGNQRKELVIDKEPKVSFAICEGDELVAAYAYCNLHGLWKTEA